VPVQAEFNAKAPNGKDAKKPRQSPNESGVRRLQPNLDVQDQAESLSTISAFAVLSLNFVAFCGDFSGAWLCAEHQPLRV